MRPLREEYDLRCEMMEGKIIVDSCCDLAPGMAQALNVTKVPLTLRLGDVEYLDDDSLSLPDFMQKMSTCTKPVGSAAPAPLLYQQAFEQSAPSYAVTLSSKLSCSHSSAMLAKGLAEENGYSEIHVFDSKSASAGQTLVALKLNDLLRQGLSRQAIIRSVESFIAGMKTYFVLERYDNLLKNGRLNKLTGTIISIMNIKLIMGDDSNGNIALCAKLRGMKNVLEKLIDMIGRSGKRTENERLVISHCNNEGLAQQLCRTIQQQFQFKEIHIVPTGGVSSLYADEKGIIMAF